MKITIAYTAGEEKSAGLVADFVRNLLGAAKLRRSERHKPFLHIYISTKGEKPPLDSSTES